MKSATRTLNYLFFIVSGGQFVTLVSMGFLAFFLVLFCTRIASADLSDGLIAHWTFDDCTAADITRSGYNGTLSGGPLCIDGFEGKALDFDAINDHIRLNKTLDANSLRAVSFWLNSRGPDGRNDAGVVLAKYSWHNRRSFLISSHDGTDSKITVIFYANGTGSVVDSVSSYYEDPTVLDPTKYTIVNNEKLATNSWEHVVVNVTNTELEIWINGRLTNKVKRDYATYFNSSEPTYIGNAFLIGRDFTYDFRQNGPLDDFRIYDRPLSELEIQELSRRRMFIQPKTGGDTGSVTVQIYRDGFKEGASVKLVRTGALDIVGSPVSVGQNGRRISTTFDLVGKTRGAWDVVVENPDSTSFILAEGFTIERGRAAQIWADIIGLPVFRPGRSQRFFILYGNTGNVDSPAAFATLSGIPKNANVNIGFNVSVNVLPAPLNHPPFSDITLETNNEKVLPLLLRRVPAGFNGILPIELILPVSVPVTLTVYLGTL